MTFNRNNKDHKYSEIQIMKWFIIKEKLVCQELNKLEDSSDKLLTGLFWCPRKFKPTLDSKLKEISEQKGMQPPHIDLIEDYDTELFTRPTYIETNDVTQAF